MSKRAFSRAFDMPTVDPDKEDEWTGILTATDIEKGWQKVAEAFNKAKVSEKMLGECPVVAKNSCNHEWKDYLGLSEQFTYCVHCDEKRK